MTQQERQKLYQEVYNDVRCGIDTCSHTCGMFLQKCATIYYNDDADAPAQIDLGSYEITMNPKLIAEEISDVIQEVVDAGHDTGEVFGGIMASFNCFISDRCHSDTEQITAVFKLFLTLHEIGHYLYSPDIAMIKKYATTYCPQIPPELVMAVLNIVEDSFIQAQFRKEYPGRVYNEAFKLGQKYLQGDIKGYGQHVIEDQTINIQNKLYYFILRAYNEGEADVLNMWGHPEKLGWSKETVASFDEAQIFVDKESRCKYVTEELVPRIFADLVEYVQQEGQAGMEGSLLNDDQIRVSDGQSHSDGQNDEQSSGQQGSSESGKSSTVKSDQEKGEDQEQEQGDGQEDDKGGEEDESGENDGQEELEDSDEEDSGSSDDDGDDGDDGDAGDDTGTSDEVQDENSEKVNNNRASASATPKNSASKQFASEEEILEDFKKNLAEACEELMHHLNETMDGREKAPKNSFKPETDRTKSKRAMDAAGCASVPWNSSAYLYDRRFLPPDALRLYEECSAYFSKLYNMDDYTIHRLNNGEIDPATIVEWFTEKNHSIYKLDVRTTQGRTFQIIFILDMSGSMGYRFIESSKIIAAIAHAMDDHHIPSAIYLFDDKSVQVKELNDPIVLNYDGSSDVYSALLRNRRGGCTNPSGAFDALVYDPIYQTDDTKIVFFLTDGCMDNCDVEQVVQEDIEELTARGNWFFVSIGIDFDTTDLKRLESFTKPGICKAYSLKEISDKLGEDIYNIIIDNFIKI